MEGPYLRFCFVDFESKDLIVYDKDSTLFGFNDEEGLDKFILFITIYGVFL